MSDQENEETTPETTLERETRLANETAPDESEQTTTVPEPAPAPEQEGGEQPQQAS
jgi:hypothetical protein